MRKNYIWNPATYSCKNGKYLANIMDDSVITCDEIIEETKSVPTNLNEKKVTCKTQNFYILLSFLSVTIVLLIVVSLLLSDKISSKTKILVTISRHK